MLYGISKILLRWGKDHWCYTFRGIPSLIFGPLKPLCRNVAKYLLVDMSRFQSELQSCGELFGTLVLVDEFACMLLNVPAGSSEPGVNFTLSARWTLGQRREMGHSGQIYWTADDIPRSDDDYSLSDALDRNIC